IKKIFWGGGPPPPPPDCRARSPHRADSGTGEETDILITMDADDTHDPEYIPELVNRIRKGADVVIASRFCGGGSERGVSVPRRFLSRGVILFMRLAAPVPGVRDYSCGYRGYSAKILHDAADTFGSRLIETDGFSVMTELLIKLAALGARIEEIPFTLHYDRKVGKSKIKLIPTLKGYFAIILIARRIHKKRLDGKCEM
ncbi:MAG: glycosyltransferase, partial [bacterium]